MLKKTITFEDYDGNTVSVDFYFNLSKAELVVLETSEKKGFAHALQEVVKSEDNKLIIENFKKLILLAYGQKSLDGRRFIKSEELRTEFSQTEAYSELFVELATDAGAAAAFVSGVVPAKMAQDAMASTHATEGVVDLPTAPPKLEGEKSSMIIPAKNWFRCPKSSSKGL